MHIALPCPPDMHMCMVHIATSHPLCAHPALGFDPTLACTLSYFTHYEVLYLYQTLVNTILSTLPDADAVHCSMLYTTRHWCTHRLTLAVTVTHVAHSGGHWRTHHAPWWTLADLSPMPPATGRLIPCCDRHQSAYCECEDGGSGGDHANWAQSVATV